MVIESPISREPQGPSHLKELLINQSKIKAVLFDMDGLLVDTEVLGIEVAVGLCKELGVDLDEGEQQGFIGITVEEFYRNLFQRRNLNYEVPLVLERHFRGYEQIIQTDFREFEGSCTLPKELKTNGFRLALVSGSTRNQVETILGGLKIRDQFETIISFDDIENGKPNPEGYLKAAIKLGVNPSECLVLEDANAGIQAGKSAGMIVAGVINRGGQDLSFADFIIPNLAAIQNTPQS